MRKIINNLIFDTEKAEFVWEDKFWPYYCDRYYKTVNNRWFLFRQQSVGGFIIKDIEQVLSEAVLNKMPGDLKNFYFGEFGYA